MKNRLMYVLSAFLWLGLFALLWVACSNSNNEGDSGAFFNSVEEEEEEAFADEIAFAEGQIDWMTDGERRSLRVADAASDPLTLAEECEWALGDMDEPPTYEGSDPDVKAIEDATWDAFRSLRTGYRACGRMMFEDAIDYFDDATDSINEATVLTQKVTDDLEEVME